MLLHAHDAVSEMQGRKKTLHRNMQDMIFCFSNTGRKELGVVDMLHTVSKDTDRRTGSVEGIAEDG